MSALRRFTIAKDCNTFIQRFNMHGRKINFNIKPVPTTEDPVKWIKNAIEDIMTVSSENLLSTDYVGITFCGESFKERGPGWLNFKQFAEIKMEDVWNMISGIFQSNSEGLNTDTFCLSITSIRMPRGCRKNAVKYNTFNEECAMRRGIITISNKDNLCLPRAIVTAVAYAENIDPKEKNKVRKDIGKLQTSLATRLCENAGVEIPEEGSGIRELNKIQDHMSNHKITVYSYGGKGREVIFERNLENAQYRLNLLHHEGHFNVITSLTAAFCCNYYCEKCHIPHNNIHGHRCNHSCPCCQNSPPCEKQIEIPCNECFRKFRGQQCFDNHKAGTQSICVKIRRCKMCLKTFLASRVHVCNETYCKNCKVHVPADHFCYIQVDRRSPVKKDTLFIFYDLETKQEVCLYNNTFEHEPNLCVYEKRCEHCIDDTDLYFCRNCGIRCIVYKEEDVVGKFIKDILEARKKFKKVIVIAHNGQAFDHQFILQHMFKQSDVKPELIMCGTKIILMILDNVKFIDSLNYFPMALACLPKAFDLPTTYKKGYFPHLFNTTENTNYIGQLPDIKYYGPDSMKTDARKEFLVWHNQHKNDNFDMQRDIVDYCKSDVKILAEACLKFQKLLLEECNVCPFSEATTIASTCNLVFRRNFLLPNTIGLIPKNGYRNVDKQSKVALQWLIWEGDQRKIDIRHAGNQREEIIKGIKVDGYCKETKQIFEFHGCYYHGHSECMHHNRNTPLHDNPNDTLTLRNESTTAKIERLRSFGYEVIEMWECHFYKKLSINSEMYYLKNHHLLISTPLNPRDAFFGGRTGNTRTYYKCKPGEKIKYIDVCSLYPWVCKYGKFPVGHPKIYVGDTECRRLNLQSTNGMVKCIVLPPQNLYHPVLPIKQNNKLMFSLCKMCSEEKNPEDCLHSEQERALNGTWVIDEVLLAIQKGYRILDIQEIWKYETIQYDRTASTPGLFTKMMNKFLKLKQEASGWPLSCRTEAEKEAYILNFLNQEEIQLEYQSIIKNGGKRSLAKLILNSFWGKFGQRENQPKTSIIYQPKDLYALLTDPCKSVCHILPVNENTLIVNWEYKDEAAEPLSTVNVCIAAYTTAQARLKLYEYLEEIGDRVLYYDTDSVIYVSKDGAPEPSTGNNIGDMTDELEEYGVGSYITEFVSGGPKNYAYKVCCAEDNTSKTVCKVKGICLNYNSSKLLNFEVMKDMIINEAEDISIISLNIRRTQDHKIVTVQETKNYGPMAKKRLFLSNYDSIPFGFKRR